MATNSVKIELDLSGLQGVATVAKQRAITRKVAMKMARVIKPAVKAEAPKRTGTLKQAIWAKATKGRKGKTISFAVVGARKAVRRKVTVKGVAGRGTFSELAVPFNYQNLVALGTKPHSLTKGGGGKSHPGARANNFLRRGYESKKSEAAAEGQRVASEEFRAVIAKQSQRIMAKISKR
jgi:hypothetical protein